MNPMIPSSTTLPNLSQINRSDNLFDLFADVNVSSSQTKPAATGNMAAPTSAANPNSIWQGKVDISLDNLSPYSKGAKQANANAVPLKAMMGQPATTTTTSTTTPTSMVSPLGQSKAPNFFPSQPLSPTGTSNYNISTATATKPAAASSAANVPFTPFQNELNQFKSLNFDMNKK